LAPAFGIGLLTGVFLFVANNYGPEAWVQAQAGYYPSLAVRVLFGGVTEEVLLRWGLMSSVLWLLWRLLQQGHGTPRSYLAWIAILLSALIFGVAHLPAVSMELGGLSGPIAAFIVGGNTIAGIAFGWLYWRHGLETAMIAHTVAHIVNYAVGG
jgi:membrane protease YdiL (CAAX protease family)